MSVLERLGESHYLPTGTQAWIGYFPFPKEEELIQMYRAFCEATEENLSVEGGIEGFINLLREGYAPWERRSRTITQQSYVSWTTDRSSLKKRVSSLLEKAGEEGWDGEGAARLEGETVKVAQELVDRFPVHVVHGYALDILDIDVTPHGEVDFDWVVDRDRMMTVSVLPSKEIAFSGLFHGARVNGCESWNGTLPQFVNCCFERLGKPGSI